MQELDVGHNVHTPGNWSSWNGLLSQPLSGVCSMPTRIVVLLAEDEELIRMVAAEALRDEGFEVIEAMHADEALASLETHATVIHVLFTDIHMPGTIDGLALAHHTARSWPWIALLITSGLARPDGSMLPGQSRFLPKPYHPAHAISHIREMVPV
jgi:two-component system, response regulator PdtaR